MEESLLDFFDLLPSIVPAGILIGIALGEVWGPKRPSATMLATGAGLCMVLGFAWLAVPALAAILLGNDPRDLTTFGAVGALFLGVALLSALRPAFTASRVQPADVLRSE